MNTSMLNPLQILNRVAYFLAEQHEAHGASREPFETVIRLYNECWNMEYWTYDPTMAFGTNTR